MSLPLKLVAGILTDAQKAAIALTLAQDLSSSENSMALADLIRDVDEDTMKKILPNVKEECLKAVSSGDSEATTSTINYANSSAEICTAILQHVLQLLEASLEGVQILRKGEHYGSEEPLRNEEIFNVVQFLAQFFLNVSLEANPLAEKVDEVVLLFLGHIDDEVSRMALSAIRWRVESIATRASRDEQFATYLWNIVFDLLQPLATKQHTHNAYGLWLRLVSTKNVNLLDDLYFQNSVVSKDNYWKTLQKGLAGNSHEIRKFCLSILRFSLQSISKSFDTEALLWDMAYVKEGLEEWSTYTTLYEIVGIDTSLHQAQGAQNEILDLFTPESRIHPSWGFCLLSTGFKSSMNSVRKYSAQLLLSIKSENLHLLKYGLPYLKLTFLPYMLQSSHFTVRPSNSLTNELSCVYGAQLVNFIANVFHSLKTQEDYDMVSSSILEVLVSIRETFDAVKIYTALGILKGLQGKHVLRYGICDKLIVKLFDDFSEGELFRRALQTTILKLILCFKLENIENFNSIMNTFINFNGTEIVVENQREILEYLKQSQVTSTDILNHLKASGVIIHSSFLWYIFMKMTDSMEDVTELLQKADDQTTLSLTAYDFRVGQMKHLDARLGVIIERAIEGKEIESTYSILSRIPNQNLPLTGDVNIENLWDLLTLNFQSDKFDELLLGMSKLKFLNNVVPLAKRTKGLSEAMELQEVMFSNSTGLKSRNDYYKLREEGIGQLHIHYQRILERHYEPEMDSVLISTLAFGTTHATTLRAICSIILLMLEQKAHDEAAITAAIFGMCESWEELSNERLRLSEKELHWACIDVMFHPVILDKACNEEFVSDAVGAFSQSIIENSYGRRGLIPRMIKRLSDYQVQNPSKFELLSFIPEALVRIACHRQVASHAFKIEPLIGEIYDRELAPAQSSIYENVYGPEEILGKVSLFAILNSIKSERLATALIDCILGENDEFRMVSITKQTDGFEEFVRCLLAKVILSVINKVSSEKVRLGYFEKFNYFIENDPSPLVRIYFEWVIALHLLKNHALSEIYFKKVADSLESHEMKPTTVTIYERILYLMITSLDEKLETKYLTRLLTIIVPAASTNKAITRHFSMSLATSVHEEISRKHLPLDETLITLVENMYKSAVASSAFGQYRSGDALLWDIVNDFDLVSISGGILLRLCDREIDFVTTEQFNRYLTKEQKEILNCPVGRDRIHLWVAKIKADQQHNRDLEEASAASLMPLQTKSGAWSMVMDVKDSATGDDVKRSDLIVVASLVSKAPNLGGICRLCDVLGAGLMTIFDMKMTKNAQFRNVAVTADCWMPMKEVPPSDVRDYLREKKMEGYTLIGLEQTDKSVVLNSELEFPKKSLILLGREKEGIPGELLVELDFCVEIKQVGVVRSMNIQTATAVICHAYSLQHC
uniref:tRNA/rRNA methyltransferase SpoU type domain-containing protein n=1 Tax=Candidozyma auris TaxID=498019 RepID=A0A0L0P2E5_CANAR